MSAPDHEPLKLGSPRSALLHAILFFPLRVILLCISGLLWLVRLGRPPRPAPRIEDLPEDVIVSRLGKSHDDDLHLLRALLAKGGAARSIAAWSRISEAGRISITAHLRSRAVRWTRDALRICDHALDDPLPAVARNAAQALSERTVEWIESEHPSLADFGAFSRPPSTEDPAWLQEHVKRWRARGQPGLKQLADDVERRLLRASALRGLLERWHSFPKDGSALARAPFDVLFPKPAPHSGTLRIRRSSNYAADASPVPAVFELAVGDVRGRSRPVEVELDDHAIFLGALEATSAANAHLFVDTDPAWQAAFWKQLAIHPSLFALDGCDGEVFSLPGAGRLVVTDSELAAYAVAVLDDPQRGTILAVLVTEVSVQGHSEPLPPFVTTIDLATLLAQRAPGNAGLLPGSLPEA